MLWTIPSSTHFELYLQTSLALQVCSDPFMDSGAIQANIPLKDTGTEWLSVAKPNGPIFSVFFEESPSLNGSIIRTAESKNTWTRNFNNYLVSLLLSPNIRT